MKVNIKERIEHLQNTVTVMGVLCFLGIILTSATYPELTWKVSLVCLGPFALMFGWCIGLMDAQRNAEL